MAKLNHQKRSRPRPIALRRRNTREHRADLDSRNSMERWDRRESPGPLHAVANAVDSEALARPETAQSG